MDPDEPHCWVAYYGDRSDFVIFDNELDCLRQAVSGSMQVAKWYYGQDFASATA